MGLKIDLDNIPASLREPVEGYRELLPALLPSHFPDDMDVDSAIGFIQGAILHQDTIHDDTAKQMGLNLSRVFRATIESVDIIERKGESGYVLGKKAKITYSAKNKKGDVEEDASFTGWVEYNGFDPAQYAWEVALANTVVNIAEANIGKEVFVRKAFMYVESLAEGDNVRFLADVKPMGGKPESGSKPSRERRSDSGRPSGRGRRPEPEPEPEPADEGDWDAEALLGLLTKKETDESGIEDADADWIASVLNDNDLDAAIDEVALEFGITVDIPDTEDEDEIVRQMMVQVADSID